MHLQVGRAYGDLVLPMSGHDLRDLTEPPRCGVLQYPTRTFPASELAGGMYATRCMVSWRGMEKTTVYLPDELKRALRRAARSTGRSEADSHPRGVGLVTGTHRIAEPRLPLFESGQPDLAERADELLAGFGDR